MQETKMKIIPTLSDLQLAVSRTTVKVKNSKGERYAPDEIVFLVHGYDPRIDMHVDSVASISLEEATKLIGVLSELISNND